MSELKKQQILIAAVSAAFLANPEAEHLHVTEDGNCFTEANKGHASWHAKTNNLQLLKVDRKEYEKAIADMDATIKAEKELAEKLAAEEAAKKQAEKDEADAEAKKAADERAALSARALAVNLPEDATEVEIREAEEAKAKADAEAKAAEETKAGKGKGK